jgi:hypothetical protein
MLDRHYAGVMAEFDGRQVPAGRADTAGQERAGAEADAI